MVGYDRVSEGFELKLFRPDTLVKGWKAKVPTEQENFIEIISQAMQSIGSVDTV